MLGQFSELVNREMFWVVTEVCSESNVVRRSKIIKQFIKVARKYSKLAAPSLSAVTSHSKVPELGKLFNSTGS